jgi:hypothetical protein
VLKAKKHSRVLHSAKLDVERFDSEGVAGFPVNASKPGEPFEAYYFRRFPDLKTALNEYKLENVGPIPPKEAVGKGFATLVERLPELKKRADFPALVKRSASTGPKDQKEAEEDFLAALEERAVIMSVRNLEMKPFREEAVASILRALGNPPDEDYCAALEEAARWGKERIERAGVKCAEAVGLSPDPAVRVAWEVLVDVRPLIWLYGRPSFFFLRAAPKLYPVFFDPKHIGPFDDPKKKSALGHTLWTWGFGAFYNGAVRRAFLEASPETIRRVLSEAEGRSAPKSEAGPGRPGVSASDVKDAYDKSMDYVKGIDPAERWTDRAPWWADNSGKWARRHRSPSADSMTREFVKDDLAISRRTIRRKLPRVRKRSQ